MKIIAHMPARAESKRLNLKNLQNLNGQPVMYYGIRTALEVERISDVYVNTESDIIINAVKDLPVKIYKRDPKLSEDLVTQDRFNYDFICKNSCDYFLLINPICPLITKEDISNVIDFCIKGNFDSVFTTTKHETHGLFHDKPLNFRTTGHLERTQDLAPYFSINWAINMWKREAFIDAYERDGYGVFIGNIGYFEIPNPRGLKINYEHDLMLAEALIKLAASKN